MDKQDQYLRFKQTGCCPHCDNESFFIRAKVGHAHWEYTCKECKFKWSKPTINITDREICQ